MEGRLQGTAAAVLRCHRGGVCSCTRRSRFQFAKADAQSQCLADMCTQRVGEGTRRREANGGVGAPDADPSSPDGAGPRKASWLVNCVSRRQLLGFMPRCPKPGLLRSPHCPTNRLEETALTCVKRKDQGLFSFLSRSRAANGPREAKCGTARGKRDHLRRLAGLRYCALMSVLVRLMGAFSVEVDGRILDQGDFRRRSAAAGGEDSRAGPAPSDASRAGHGLSVAAASIAQRGESAAQGRSLRAAGHRRGGLCEPAATRWSPCSARGP